MRVNSSPVVSIGTIDVLSPIIVGLIFIMLASLIREPRRREFNAIMVAGAGAAYLGAGLGVWEFVYTTVATYIAYRGLRSYSFVGVAWILHSGWDIVHHFYGNPIVPFITRSSLGCAICDPVIAVWCFMGAPSFLRRRGQVDSQATPPNKPLQPTAEKRGD
jgi:Family of unknown function (DUF6010)